MYAEFWNKAAWLNLKLISIDTGESGQHKAGAEILASALLICKLIFTSAGNLNACDPRPETNSEKIWLEIQNILDSSPHLVFTHIWNETEEERSYQFFSLWKIHKQNTPRLVYFFRFIAKITSLTLWSLKHAACFGLGSHQSALSYSLLGDK